MTTYDSNIPVHMRAEWSGTTVTLNLYSYTGTGQPALSASDAVVADTTVSAEVLIDSAPSITITGVSATPVRPAPPITWGVSNGVYTANFPAPEETREQYEWAIEVQVSYAGPDGRVELTLDPRMLVRRTNV